jgi:hypothetical protein
MHLRIIPSSLGRSPLDKAPSNTSDIATEARQQQPAATSRAAARIIVLTDSTALPWRVWVGGVHLFFFRRSTAQLHGAFKPVPAHRSQHVHGRCRTLTTASCLTPPPRPAYPSPPEYVLCTKVEHRSHRQLAVRAHHDWSIYPHLLALPAQHPSLTNINTIVL